MVSIPKTIGDFSVLPVQLPQLPSFTLPTPATHFLYVRRNAPKIPTDDDDRSLFLANVPADATEELFRELFASLVGPGRFESVTFEEARRQRREIFGGSDGEDETDDDDDDDASSDIDVMPRQAAQLKALQTRKRKRDAGGRTSGGDDNDGKTGSNTNSSAQLRRQAKLPPTWPQTLRRSGSTAVALFADAKSVDVVLKAIGKVHKSSQYPQWPASSTLGPPWLAGHNRLAYPNHATLLASVDSYFALFNRKEAEAAELARRLRNVPDEDGFVTVTRSAGGRSAPARHDEAAAARAKQLAKQEQQRAEMTSFYRFQLRERKKEEQAEMQRRFLEDQKRVAAMREKRNKFKPEV